ncbi:MULTISPECIES: hypothetical protein [unclassified Lysobacter]|uniref:hypothetical protein n=1 Tax=unclassified Lysobacter TaxID=2635362 RepID=UPI001BEB1EA4|nr:MULTISPECIES: hypothetical protein [unclassified Lysobacter]MBT2746213.1 hypothetical protein [Lysobacter sp. ISL-42]MBT2750758.1 hypothetical protein [Lysobacter sp. ISL-50]MBT2776095.1 hypothetical protein [Lysobacter sp. ISL-54]MBT2784601.1 hypothetical protein [Lysobacter sp. ISL-52]
MGIHVSYHPFSPAEVHALYFDSVGRSACIERLALQLGLDPDASARLKTLLSHGGRDRPNGMSLSEAHAYNLDKVSSLLRDCWYTSDCRFSALLEYPDFCQYVIDWRNLMAEDIVLERCPHERGTFRDDGIFFLSCKALRQLRAEHAEHGVVRSQLARVFSRGWLPIFWAAADHAVTRQCGLIEAVNLVRPDVITPSSLMV